MWSSLVRVCSRCNVGYFFHSSSFWGSLAQGLVFVSMCFNNATSYNSLSTQSIFVSSTWACLSCSIFLSIYWNWSCSQNRKVFLVGQWTRNATGPKGQIILCSLSWQSAAFWFCLISRNALQMIAMDDRKQTFIVSLRVVLKQPNKILLTIGLYKGIFTTQKYSVVIWWYIVFKLCGCNGFICC